MDEKHSIGGVINAILYDVRTGCQWRALPKNFPNWKSVYTLFWRGRTRRCSCGVKYLVILPKRWIVERTFGWLGRWRRHSKDYERNPKTSETMMSISVIYNMSRHLAHAKN